MKRGSRSPQVLSDDGGGHFSEARERFDEKGGLRLRVKNQIKFFFDGREKNFSGSRKKWKKMTRWRPTFSPLVDDPAKLSDSCRLLLLMLLSSLLLIACVLMDA